jgi:hypothetical protein
MKQELRRATKEEQVVYLNGLRNYKPKNDCERIAREQDSKYIPMSNDELYHYFMNNPIQDHGSFQVIYHESGEVPRLFKKGKKFISIGVALRELRKEEE